MPADSHCHINDPAFDEDRAEVIEQIRASGIKYILNVGYDIATSRKAVELAEEHDFMYAAVGIHPHNAATLDINVLAELAELALHAKVVAIGEMGLDYFRDLSPRDVQKDAFRKQMDLAMRLGKPVVIHSRDAMTDTLAILNEFDVGETSGVMHCFSGSVDDLRKVLEMGMFASFTGAITYPKADGLREALAATPGHQLLLETDSPYLSPQSRRGKRNDPTNMAEIIAKAAEVRGVTVADIERIVVKNFEVLFEIGEMTEGETVYQIRNSLYVNVTPHCTNECPFCTRYHSDTVQGHNLRITREPTAQRMIEAIGDPTRYEEIVFCGFGEPTLRIADVKEVARYVKDNGGKTRLNTNGHGIRIAKDDITHGLVGLIDKVSVSLNAADAETYNKICHPIIPNAWEVTVNFIACAKEAGLDVTATAVAIPEVVDIEEVRQLAEDELGVKFRARGYNLTG